MYRLTRHDIEVEVGVALSTALRNHRAQLRSKNLTIQQSLDAAVIRAVLNVVDCYHSCVVRADRVGFSMAERHGRFGQDEPWPALLHMELQAVKAPKAD